MNKKLSLLLLFLLISGSAFAQRQALSGDLDFFRERAQVYQRWLDSTGMGAAIRLDQIRLKESDNTELELHLLLRTQDPDTAAGIWKRLRQDVEIQGEKDIYSTLFNTFIFMMEVPPEQGDIQIRLRDANGYMVTCFSINIWSDSNTVKYKERSDQCRAQPFDVVFRDKIVQKDLKGKKAAVKKPLSADETYAQIGQYFRQTFPKEKYNNSDCSGRYPEVECRKISDTHFLITVSDLCREALTGSKNSTWCTLMRSIQLDANCNDMRRERLEFEFEYIPDPGGGFRLKGNLNGKFGSAAYKPRAQGWWSMEPDFKSFEVAYTEKLLAELQAYLSRK